jgi:hypothetical protein
VVLEKARFKLRADGRFRLDARVEFAVPPALDPATGGLRLVVRDALGDGVLDLVAAGGAGWTARGARWTFAADAGPIRKATLRDQGGKHPGRVKLSLRGEAGALVLPDPAGLETVALLSPEACAALTWNPPQAARPRCRAAGDALSCR